MTNNSEEIVKDPVCGMTKPKSEMKAQAIFEDKTYYFCSEMDKEMFLAHPKNWATNKNS